MCNISFYNYFKIIFIFTIYGDANFYGFFFLIYYFVDLEEATIISVMLFGINYGFIVSH